MLANNKQLISFLKIYNDKIQCNKQYLTELDQVIGDGDHGINMSRGMNAVMEKLDSFSGKSCGEILKAVGITLVSTVGGASGPLYGTAFMKAGTCIVDKENISSNDVCEMLKAALEGIKMRGHATTGEKTIIDCLDPACKSFKECIENNKNIFEAIEKSISSAKDGVEYTKTIIATKGRASYLGKRSIGHQDPGATSMLFLIESIKDTLIGLSF